MEGLRRVDSRVDMFGNVVKWERCSNNICVIQEILFRVLFCHMKQAINIAML